MIYIEHYRIQNKYRKAQKVVEEILDEKEKRFQRTQPKSTIGEYEREFDKSISVGAKGGSKVNQIEEYIIEKDESRLDERLEEAKAMCEEWAELLRQKEEEVRASKNIDDELYTMRYLDNMKVERIAVKLHYSKSQIYRRLEQIEHSFKYATK